MSEGLPSNLRSGVTHSVITRKRIVQSPVMCSMCSTGFAPRSSFRNSRNSSPTGTRHNRNTTTLSHRIMARLVVLLQVHAGVEACHLVAVAVERQRFDAREHVRQPMFGGLRP